MIANRFSGLFIPFRRHLIHFHNRHLQNPAGRLRIAAPLERHFACSRTLHPTTGIGLHFTQDTIASRTALIARHFSSSTPVAGNSSTREKEQPDRNMPSPYSVRRVGQPNTLDYRVYVEKDGVPLSWFHDIPLYANEQHTVLNMIVEIPRWTNAKLEVGSLYDACVNGNPAGSTATRILRIIYCQY